MDDKKVMLRCDEETYNWLQQITKSGKYRSMNAALIALIIDKAKALKLDKKPKS